VTTAAAFADAIRAAGMVPPRGIEPGRLVRFPGAGKRRGAAGWAEHRVGAGRDCAA